MDGCFFSFTISRGTHDLLQKLYDFGDTFAFECLVKENNVFWKDVLHFLSCNIKSSNNHPTITDNFVNAP